MLVQSTNELRGQYKFCGETHIANSRRAPPPAVRPAFYACRLLRSGVERLARLVLDGKAQR